MVTFSGVDGAGKTTVLSEVKKYLENRHSLKVIELRQRPSLLPILSSIKHGKKVAEAKTMQALPRLGTNASKLSSYIRFFYYLTDYLIGQLYIYLKYTSKGYLVLYDRYYFDYIVDPRRANIVIDERIPHFFYNLIFKPTVNVFLFAAPKEILQRKQELDEPTILELAENYKSLFHNLDEKNSERYICINNSNLDDTLDIIRGVLDGYINR